MKKKAEVKVTSAMILDYLCRLLLKNSIHFFTRFYPFSKFYRDSIYHYKNRCLKVLEEIILKELKKYKYHIFYIDASEDSPFVTYCIYFFRGSDKKIIKERYTFVKNIARNYKIDYRSIYFNLLEMPMHWKLQIPYEYVFKDYERQENVI